MHRTQHNHGEINQLLSADGRTDNGLIASQTMANAFSAHVTNRPLTTAMLPLIEDVTLTFAVSDNEEQVMLSAMVDGQQLLVDGQTCHYMLLLLARQRLIDQVLGLEEHQLGWLSQQDFNGMLGKQQHLLFPQLLAFTKDTVQRVTLLSEIKFIALPSLVEMNETHIRFAHDNIHIQHSDWC